MQFCACATSYSVTCTDRHDDVVAPLIHKTWGNKQSSKENLNTSLYRCVVCMVGCISIKVAQHKLTMHIFTFNDYLSNHSSISLTL